MDEKRLGVRLRSLRAARRLSIIELARLSGVSRSMISEVERGGRRPTVLVLDRLATALGTSLARLARDEVDGRRAVVLRRGEQDVFADPSGWQRRVLSPVLPGVEFEFMRTELAPRVDAGVFAAHEAGSREYAAVERGVLRLRLEEDEHLLEPGDAMFYPGDQPHGFANEQSEPCVYYLVMDALGGHRPAAGAGR